MRENDNPGLRFRPRSPALRSTLPVLLVGQQISDAEIRTMMVRMLLVAIVAFIVCGSLLWSFWKSLEEESDRGEVRFSRQSRRRLLYLVSSLILFGLVFTFLAYNAP